MASQEIYNPLKEYDAIYRKKFRDIASQTFQELSNASRVDTEANRRLCQEIDNLRQQLDNIQSSRSGWTVFCVVLWLAVATGVASIFLPSFFGSYWYIFLIVGVVALLVVLLLVHPKLKELSHVEKALQQQVQEKVSAAWAQMKPLNQLYDWDIFSRMLTKTLPKIELDPFFTTKRLADLKRTYGWDETFNAQRSILYAHSGLINGNPFVLCQTRKMIMGSKTYYGHKTIHWTTMERGSDGKLHSVHHSQTLTASVTRDFPGYYDKTWLIYGNTAAPDLIFNRLKNNDSLEEGSFQYNRKRRKLERKSRSLDDDFAMATNEEFEVLFTTTDRNNNQQYFLLFTPLAQESMIDLLRDETIGYGDDFEFHKNKKINAIVADHIQKQTLDMNPQQFYNYNFAQAKQHFTETTSEYFRSIYFCLAPLLCVPLYQQMRPLSDIYGREMPTESAFWEHEAQANLWGEKHFEHPQCATHSILKTQSRRHADGTVHVDVTAHGFTAKTRLTHISVLGGDGRFHRVPVEYQEYYPVTGLGSLSLREDASADDLELNPVRRRERIQQQEHATGGVYRRHIISSVRKP